MRIEQGDIMITISLCMIVKNEEAVLERCLNSVVNAVDEIIIIDTGSTDKTKEIASKFTEYIYDFEWINDFSAARNLAFSYATKDYQMWLDADDVLSEIDCKKLIDLKSTLNPDVDMVTMKYHTHFNDKDEPIMTSTRERLIKRKKKYLWQDCVHEFIPLSGNIFNTDIAINHKKIHSDKISTRNLDIYTNLENKMIQLTPRQQYYFARELKDHKQYTKAIYYFEKFLSQGKGWFEDSISSCYDLSVCYRNTGNYDKILSVLIKSFEYDSPRAEICTEIGYLYKYNKDFKTAQKWFDLAANLKKPDSIGFILRDYWGYIPNIEACVCCFELGDYEKAKEYNEHASFYKPDSEAVSINRRLLEKL